MSERRRLYNAANTKLCNIEPRAFSSCIPSTHFFIHFVFYLFQWKQKHLVLHINKRVIYTRQPHFDVIQFCASRKLISILLANKVANPSVLLEIKLRKKIEFKKLLQCLRQKCKLDKLTSVRWRQHALLSNYHNSIQKFRRRCHESHRKRKFLY